LLQANLHFNVIQLAAITLNAANKLNSFLFQAAHTNTHTKSCFYNYFFTISYHSNIHSNNNNNNITELGTATVGFVGNTHCLLLLYELIVQTFHERQ